MTCLRNFNQFELVFITNIVELHSRIKFLRHRTCLYNIYTVSQKDSQF